MRTDRRRVHARSESDGMLALVLAGGAGTRLRALTRTRAKPAVPFGAHFRIVDFTLSNCLRSGARRVAVLTQYQPESLIRHVQSHWQDPACMGSFVELWKAERCRRGRYEGTADAVHQNRDLIRAAAAEHVLVVAGDHVYSMDYAAMLAEHKARGARVTVACVEVPITEAASFGIVDVDSELKIRRFTEKPDRASPLPGRPDAALASMGIYLFETRFLLDRLEADALDPSSAHDFGRNVFPQLVEHVDVRAHLFRDETGAVGYWRDVGTIDSYWSAHQELLLAGTGIELESVGYPMRGAHGSVKPAHLASTANVKASIVGAGTLVEGTVRRSVISSDCRIAAGAEVVQSVLLPGASVGRGCRLDGVVIDSHCCVPDGTVIDASLRSVPDWLGREPYISPKGIVLLTQETFVPDTVVAEKKIA